MKPEIILNPPTCEYPWAILREDTGSPWDDLNAWEKWVDEWNGFPDLPGSEILEMVGEEPWGKGALYCLMCEAIGGSIHQ